MNNHIPIVEKHELSLSSPFVGLDKPAYLTQGLPTEPLPFVTTGSFSLFGPTAQSWELIALCSVDSEIDEICGLLQRKREQEPTRWRRFVVVVDQVDPKLADKTKNRGVRGPHTCMSLLPTTERLPCFARLNCVLGLD